MGVCLCVSESGYRSLVYGGKVDEKHVEAAAPVIGLFRCALSNYRLGGKAEQWGVMEWLVYHCLSVLCMFWAVRGVGKLSGS